MLVGRRFAIRRLPIFVGYFESDDVHPLLRASPQ
jgi:hypothetical protein